MNFKNNSPSMFGHKDGTTEWIYYPDYSKTNPYQNLLAGSLPNGVSAYAGDIDEALKQARTAYVKGQRRKVTFHLHWLTPIINNARNKHEARRFAENFIAKIRALKSLECNIVWTLHNTTSHDNVYVDEEIFLSKRLSELSDVIHTHSKKVAELVSPQFHLPTDKVVCLPHPGMEGVYPNYVTKKDSRKRFNIPDDRVVFAFLGQLRPYKGIEELIDAYASIKVDLGNTHLILAGKPVHPFSAGTVKYLAGRIDDVTVIEEFLPDDALQWVLNAADFVVLPYRKILTSGSVLNAMSFGKPVIAPDLGVLSDHITPTTGYLYPHDDKEGLTDALRKAAKLSISERNTLSLNARTRAADFSWTDFSSALSDAVKQIPKWSLNDIALPSGNKTSFRISREIKSTYRNRVAIIILSYKNLSDVTRLAKSLAVSHNREFDVILVDNNSPGINLFDLEHIFQGLDIPRICLQTVENLGYAGGNNVGITIASNFKYEFIWILNPDITVAPDALDQLINAAESQDENSIFGASIYYGHRPDVVWSAGADISFTTGLSAAHRYNGLTSEAVPSEPYSCGYITGASIFCRSRIFREHGLLPEDYFLYFEESDWCLTLKEKKVVALVAPKARLWHHKRSEASNLPAPYYFYYYVRNAINFTRKFSPGSLKKSVNRVQREFIETWLEKPQLKLSPDLSRYERLSEQALRDGLAGVTGPVDLGKIMDEGANIESIQAVIDVVAPDRIAGWAWDATSPTKPLHLKVICNDAEISQLIANEYREDLKIAGIGSGYHAFDTLLPPGSSNGRPAAIHLKLGEQRISQDYLFLPSYVPAYRGRIDGIIDGVMRGWAYNAANFDEKVDLELHIDGSMVALCTADSYRNDLEHAGFGEGDHSFSVRLPSKYLTQPLSNIVIYLAGSDISLHKLSRLVPRGNVQPLPSGTPESQLAWCFHSREFIHDEENPTPLAKYLFANNERLVEKNQEGEREPHVSIIMPAFNREMTIENSIRSVLEQTYENFELIVVDDGSDDATVEIVNSVILQSKDTRIKLLRRSENGGVSSARNYGIENSEGEVIAYLDSDNTWHRNFLRIMVLSLYGSDKIDAAYCAQTISSSVRVGAETERQIISMRAGVFSLSLLENRNYIDLNCYVHRRSLYTNFGGFSTALRRLVDWELIWKFSHTSAPYFVPAALSIYNMDLATNQITRTEPYGENYQKIDEIFSRGVDLPIPENLAKVSIVISADASSPELWYCLKIAIASARDRLAILCIMTRNESLKIEIASKYPHALIADDTSTVTPYGTNISSVLSHVFSLNSLADILLLEENAVVSATAISELQQAARSIPNAAMLQPRYLTVSTDKRNQQYPSYASPNRPLDINFSNLSDAENFFPRNDGNHTARISNIYHSCTLLPSNSANLLVSADEAITNPTDFLRAVEVHARISRGMEVLQVAKARAHDTNCFNFSGK